MDSMEATNTQSPRRIAKMAAGPIQLGLCDFPVEMARYQDAAEVYGYAADNDVNKTIYNGITQACYQSAALRAASLVRLVLIGVK